MQPRTRAIETITDPTVRICIEAWEPYLEKL